MRGHKTILTLERKIETKDAAGGYTEVWADVMDIKGVLCNVSGNERLSADKLTVIATQNFYIDYLHSETITEEDRFSLGTRIFEINYVNNIGGNSNRALRINLLEEV
jgi:SPP1 family predicted phage head-tail adaptor